MEGNMQNTLALFVSVPVASFRVSRAREYFETFPCPPPSTIYGMLLSLVGETNRHAHEGAELAVALVSQPEYSVVLRTLWRVKNRKQGLGQGENKRPDFQELLTNIKLVIWIRQGQGEAASPSLADRVCGTIQTPGCSPRFGGLSLGESTHLVDDLRPLRKGDPEFCEVLVRDGQGTLSLPIWPDHVGSRKTCWDQFSLKRATIAELPQEEAWVAIKRANN